MDIFDGKNIDYEYWSTYYIFYKAEPVIYNRIIQKNEKVFRNIEDIQKEARKLSQETIVILEGDFKELLYLKIILLKRKIKFYEIVWGRTPNLSTKYNLKQKLKKLLNIKKVIEHFKYLILKNYYHKLFEVKESTYTLLFAGFKSLNNRKVKSISIMSEDYEKYFIAKERIKGKKQAVFLDQNLPNHPDFKILKEKTIDSKQYYLNLNKFFTEIEKKFEMEVVIAAHPKTNYDKKIFNNRKIIKFNTAEEVKNSSLIISSYSTTIGLGTIENKPIILIKTSDFSEIMNEKVKILKDKLELELIDISKKYTLHKIPNINEEKYRKYCSDYLYFDKFNKPISLKKFILTILNNEEETR